MSLIKMLELGASEGRLTRWNRVRISVLTITKCTSGMDLVLCYDINPQNSFYVQMQHFYFVRMCFNFLSDHKKLFA
jgi:hypothetical protein